MGQQAMNTKNIRRKQYVTQAKAARQQRRSNQPATAQHLNQQAQQLKMSIVVPNDNAFAAPVVPSSLSFQRATAPAMLTNAQARRRAQVLQAQREARSKMYSDLRLGRTIGERFGL